MLGIAIQPKTKGPKASRNTITKEDKKERRRQMKNENSRNDTELTGIALDAVAEFFGMKRATMLEKLAVLAEAGECCEECT